MSVLTFLVIAAVAWWLWRRSRSPNSQFAHLRGGSGGFEIEVVGESHYLDALREIAGPGEVRKECEARLWMEHDNPHDSKAVAVFIDGRQVGYLNRRDARRYRAQVEPQGNIVGICPAVIIGGGTGRENLGVWLDLPSD